MENSKQQNCIKCDKCKEIRICSVCGREYNGMSKFHLRTPIHRLYKNLLKFLKNQPEADVKKLADKFKVNYVDVVDKQEGEKPPKKKPGRKPKISIDLDKNLFDFPVNKSENKKDI